MPEVTAHGDTTVLVNGNAGLFADKAITLSGVTALHAADLLLV